MNKTERDSQEDKERERGSSRKEIEIYRARERHTEGDREQDEEVL